MEDWEVNGVHLTCGKTSKMWSPLISLNTHVAFVIWPFLLGSNNAFAFQLSFCMFNEPLIPNMSPAQRRRSERGCDDSTWHPVSLILLTVSSNSINLSTTTPFDKILGVTQHRPHCAWVYMRFIFLDILNPNTFCSISFSFILETSHSAKHFFTLKVITPGRGKTGR